MIYATGEFPYHNYRSILRNVKRKAYKKLPDIFTGTHKRHKKVSDKILKATRDFQRSPQKDTSNFKKTLKRTSNFHRRPNKTPGIFTALKRHQNFSREPKIQRHLKFSKETPKGNRI